MTNDGDWLCFSFWARRSGGENSIPHGQVLWARRTTDRDNGFYAVPDAAAQAVRQEALDNGNECDPPWEKPWRFDDEDDFAEVDEKDVPDHVWAAIAAYELIEGAT